jgi:hypothetical protein
MPSLSFTVTKGIAVFSIVYYTGKGRRGKHVVYEPLERQCVPDDRPYWESLEKVAWTPLDWDE